MVDIKQSKHPQKTVKPQQKGNHLKGYFSFSNASLDAKWDYLLFFLVLKFDIFVLLFLAATQQTSHPADYGDTVKAARPRLHRPPFGL